MEEYDIDDKNALAHSWKLHDWTGQEAQFAAQVLQHGDVSRAFSKSFGVAMSSRHSCILGGEEMMSKPWMRDYIKYVRDKIRENMEPTKERILQELSSLAFSNMADFIVIQDDGSSYTDFSNLTREQMAAISEITVDTYMEGRGEDAETVKSVKFKLAPKAAAIELLGKNQRMWTDVLEHNDLTDISETITKRRAEARKRREQEATGETEDAQPEE